MLAFCIFVRSESKKSEEKKNVRFEWDLLAAKSKIYCLNNHLIDGSNLPSLPLPLSLHSNLFMQQRVWR